MGEAKRLLARGFGEVRNTEALFDAEFIPETNVLIFLPP